MEEKKTNTKANTLEQAPKGTILIKKATVVDSIFLILKGKVRFCTESFSVKLGSGSFIGINDIYARMALGDYIVEEDITYYTISGIGEEPAKRISEENREYNGLVVYALSKFISKLMKIGEELSAGADACRELIDKLYGGYNNIISREGIKRYGAELVEAFMELEQPRLEYSKEFECFREDYRISPEIHKAYYLEAVLMTEISIKRQSEAIKRIIDINDELAIYLHKGFNALVKEEGSVFKALTATAIAMVSVSKPCTDVNEGGEYLIAEARKLQGQLAETVGLMLEQDFEKMSRVLAAACRGEEYDLEASLESEAKEEKSNEDKHYLSLQRMREMKGCLRRLIEYAEWSGDEAGDFEKNIEQFILCGDKFSAADNMRSLRKDITRGFFVLYEKIFLKTYKKENIPVFAELFLEYGVTDERLLKNEDLEILCIPRSKEEGLPCRVYTMREWLSSIYEGKKEPSKSEFDMDYFAMLRDKRKRGEITPEKAEQLANNLEERLHYEIENLFMYNNRLLNSQITTYVPIMFSEAFAGNVSSMIMSKKRINMLINKYRDVDRSIFYRELMYENKELKIEKEFVMKEYCPDIILFPAYGSRAIMWQEIEGKRRDSHARFLFPVIFEGNPDSSVISTFARFRWELCRTMLGVSWNNIQIKSLTSEYSDYIQFYNKNRDLSEERREKIKSQLQKARGSLREAFAMDYELWIKNEATGAVRLNKVAREIIATYCPFNPAIRQKLSTQPIFEEAMARFKREKLKKITELDNHYRLIKKARELPRELEVNLEYYNEL